MSVLTCCSYDELPAAVSHVWVFRLRTGLTGCPYSSSLFVAVKPLYNLMHIHKAGV